MCGCVTVLIAYLSDGKTDEKKKKIYWAAFRVLREVLRQGQIPPPSSVAEVWQSSCGDETKISFKIHLLSSLCEIL